MVFIRLYLLLYADDMVLLAESPQELQAALHGMQHYCTTWRLEVNVQKTKVMIFSRRRIRSTPDFVYNGKHLEVVSSFRYLGVDFNFNGKFHLVKSIFSTRRRKQRCLLYTSDAADE